MKHLITQAYYQLQIMLLALFNPTKLFDRINQLPWYKKTLRQWVDDQSLNNNLTILEAGCATGALTAYLKQLNNFPTGIDASSKMIEKAQFNYKDIHFLEADVMNLSLKENYFDAVFATSLINIVDDKLLALKQLVKTCKHDGHIAILVPNKNFTDVDLLNLSKHLDLSGFSQAALKMWHKSAPKMREEEIIDIFKNTGLINITKTDYLNGMVMSISATKPE